MTITRTIIQFTLTNTTSEVKFMGEISDVLKLRTDNARTWTLTSALLSRTAQRNVSEGVEEWAVSTAWTSQTVKTDLKTFEKIKFIATLIRRPEN